MDEVAFREARRKAGETMRRRHEQHGYTEAETRRNAKFTDPATRAKTHEAMRARRARGEVTEGERRRALRPP